MKRVLAVAGCVLAFTFMALVGSADARVSCWQNGNHVWCSNGQTFRKVGPIFYGNRGNSCRQTGNYVWCSNGQTFRQVGPNFYSGRVPKRAPTPRTGRAPTPRIEAALTPRPGSGTCFAVRPDGVLLTAYHVIQSAKSIGVQFPDGFPMVAKLGKFSEANDLAVLHINSPTPHFLPLAPTGSVNVGDQVFTLGYPVPDLLGKEQKYTDGAVSGMQGVAGLITHLQVTVPVQPGNSGGPLVNDRGEVVGIMTAVVALPFFVATTGAMPQNVNFGVKARYARTLFDAPTVKAVSSTRKEAIQKVRQAVCLVRTR